MKEMDILGVNRFETYSKTRIGCRGIVIQDGKLLVSREEISDYWMLPGGGLENGETLSECCAREVLEETGYLVEPIEEFLVLNEYYEEYRYISHFFICKVVGKGEQKLTPVEKMRGLVPKWVDIQFFIDVVSKHQEYAATNEEKRGAYFACAIAVVFPDGEEKTFFGTVKKVFLNAAGRTRTGTVARLILSQVRLPIPPQRQGMSYYLF